MFLLSALDIALQEKLLSPAYQDLKPDKEFLTSFAGVLGSNWPQLAAALSLSEEETDEECRMEGVSGGKQAILVLQKWALADDATYGQLCRKLQTFDFAT